MKTLLDHYRVFGASFPIPALSEEETDYYFNFCKELIDSLGGSPEPIDLTQMHLTFRKAYELTKHVKILAMVKELVGDDILVWATSIFYKAGHANDYIGWHQDCTYWSLSDEDKVVSVWIALTNSNEQNGAMRVVPCSHQFGNFEHAETADPNNKLSRKQNIDDFRFLNYSVPVNLQRGELSIHHSRLVHASQPNLTDDLRIGFVIRYIAPVVMQKGVSPKTILVSGQDRHHNFTDTECRLMDVSAESINLHRQECEEFLGQVRKSNRRNTSEVK